MADANRILEGVRKYIETDFEDRTVFKLRKSIPRTLNLEEDEELFDELNAALTVWLSFSVALIDVLAFFATPAGCFRNKLTGTFINERLHRTRKYDQGHTHTKVDGSASDLLRLCKAQAVRKLDDKSMRQAKVRSKHLAAQRLHAVAATATVQASLTQYCVKQLLGPELAAAVEWGVELQAGAYMVQLTEEPKRGGPRQFAPPRWDKISIRIVGDRLVCDPELCHLARNVRVPCRHLLAVTRCTCSIEDFDIFWTRALYCGVSWQAAEQAWGVRAVRAGGRCVAAACARARARDLLPACVRACQDGR